MKISVHSISLSFRDFLLLLEIRGLSLSEHSPLVSLLSLQPSTETSGLKESGALETDPLWLETLETICSPAYQVDSATFLGQSTLTTTYLTGPSGESLVACTPENGNIRIRFPITPEEAVQRELQLFGAGGGTMVDAPLSIAFSPDGLFLWAAGVDALREVMLASMAERLELPQIKLPVSVFETLFQGSLNDQRGDARWLVTLLRLAAPAAFAPQRQTLNLDALEELVDNGLILFTDQTQWVPTHRFFGIANDLFLQLPALMINTRQRVGENQRSLHFNGRNGLSTIEFHSDGTENVARYRTVVREDVWFSLETAFIPPRPELAPKEHPAKTRFCTGCGNRLEPGGKFCTNCGESVPR